MSSPPTASLSAPVEHRFGRIRLPDLVWLPPHPISNTEVRVRLLGVTVSGCDNSNSTQEALIRLDFCKHVPKFRAICDSESLSCCQGFCKHPMQSNRLLLTQKSRRFKCIKSECASLAHPLQSTFQTRIHSSAKNRAYSSAESRMNGQVAQS